MQSETKNFDDNKIWFVLLPLIAVGYLINFAFYGMQIRDLAAATGFVLVTYGMYKDNNIIGLSGALLVVGSILIKHLP